MKVVDERIAVTGVGCISALGGNFKDCFEAFLKQQVNLCLPTRFSNDHPDKFPVFEIDDSGVNFKDHLRERGRTAQLAVAAVQDAFDGAGLDVNEFASKRVGVCIGTTVGNSLNNESFYYQYKNGEHPPLDEMERYFISNPAEVVAEEFGFTGPTMTVANACSSGTDAIGLALSWLRQGICDVVIAGGSEELSHISYLGFGSLMIAAKEVCKPFDKNRSGLNLGEGAAMLILQREDSNDSVLGYVNRYGSACDTYHPTAPHPDGEGLRRAIAEALADVPMNELGFINAHGTGTGENDKVEMRVFGDLFPSIPYFSVKGATGHTLGAAGAIEAAITIGCLNNDVIPASVGFEAAAEEILHPPTSSCTSLGKKRFALSQSLAFGGNNSALLFEKA